MTKTLTIESGMPHSTSRSNSAWSDRLRSGKPILLDGGLSNQLESQGVDLNTPLWSALLLRDDPQQIIAAHRFYLDAGADCLISASYQASVAGFRAIGLAAEQANALILQSVSLAQCAIEQYLEDNPTVQLRPLVAASIGPYGACQADGSEYHGNYGVNDAVLADFHRQRLALLDHSEADVLACETIPSLQEARVLHQLLEAVQTSAWISFSCQDARHANDGSTIEQCAALFRDHPRVAAIGVNCTAPQYVEELIGRIKQAAPSKAIVVYPNSGEHYHPDTKSWSGTASPASCGVAARRWVEAGASIVGGCCRMGPEHIKAMKAQCQQR